MSEPLTPDEIAAKIALDYRGSSGLAAAIAAAIASERKARKKAEADNTELEAIALEATKLAQSSREAREKAEAELAKQVASGREVMGLCNDAIAAREKAEAERERMWCRACGTVSRDDECDCTRLAETEHKRNPVNYANALKAEWDTERTAREKAERERDRARRLLWTEEGLAAERTAREKAEAHEAAAYERQLELLARAEKAEAERDEREAARLAQAECARSLIAAAEARAEKAEAALGLAWQDGHHDGYADGCKAAREAALREAAALIKDTLRLVPEAASELEARVLSLIPKQEPEP